MNYVGFVIQGLTMCLAMVLFVFMQMWRWSSSGMVCSGDFLPEKHTKASDFPEYLIVEGRFLKAVIITIYVIFILSVVTIVSLAVFLHKKAEGSDQQFGTLVNKPRGMSMAMVPAYETQIENKSSNRDSQLIKE